MADLKDSDLKINVGWLRKKGWATIQEGMIKPMCATPPKGKDEEDLGYSCEGRTEE